MCLCLYGGSCNNAGAPFKPQLEVYRTDKNLHSISNKSSKERVPSSLNPCQTQEDIALL